MGSPITIVVELLVRASLISAVDEALEALDDALDLANPPPPKKSEASSSSSSSSEKANSEGGFGFALLSVRGLLAAGCGSGG